jgi:periplasmic divalent cation tolerance protein
MKQRCCVVFVTAPNLKTARRLAKSALATRLIACASLVPKVESHYVWQGRVEQSAEVWLILKTTPGRLAALRRFIEHEHPYDTPEFLALPVTTGSRKYLDWVAASVRGA